MGEAIDISNGLARAMKLKGWSQGELAIQLGCTQPQVSRWARGSACRIEAVQRRLDALLEPPAVPPFPWDVKAQPVAPPPKEPIPTRRRAYYAACRLAAIHRSVGDEEGGAAWAEQAEILAKRCRELGEDVDAWIVAWDAANPPQ